ncbi:MAG: glycosyltransferase family 2 protein [Cyclobacteriaceae bacterium]
MTDLVSIVMPVYNGEKYIGEAIRSVIHQQHTFWELIIVNDGSTDNTKDIILGISDERIRYFEQSNRGTSAARNYGIKEIRGRYFCCLDADDVLPPNSLASRLKVFESDVMARFVDGTVYVYDSILRSQLSKWSPSFKGRPFHQLVRLSGRCFFGPTWMIRLGEDIKLSFDEDLSHGEDLLLYISIANQGIYNYTDDCILYYRKNMNSTMNNIDGLARGYSYLCSIVRNNYRAETNMIDRFLILARSRKIMFLTFWNRRNYFKAINYMASGRV